MRARAWLAGVISGGSVTATEPLPTAELITAATDEGVVGLASWRLQQASADAATTAPWHSELVAAFAAAARADAVAFMVIEAETRRVLGLMQEVGMVGLLLKGSALAHWAYPQPQLRACGDVDLLLSSREAAERLSGRLTADGYMRARTSGDLVAYELLCTRAVMPGWQLEIDIHWRVTNSPLFSNALTFDELMRESIALPTLAPNARGLGLMHALLHACMHRALNLSIGLNDQLKWLYDLIVLTDHFTPTEWQRAVAVAREKQLAGVVLSGLEAAASVFAHALPVDVVTTLRTAALHEPLDASRLSDWRYMQSQTFRALPSVGQRARWLWQRAFPSRDYLTALYGEQASYGGLALLRLKRMLRRLGS
jgi:hypothetical protein